MKYFRYYPWGMQLLLFVLMVFTLSSFCAVCVPILVPKITGVALAAIADISETSPFLLIKTAVIIQGAFSLAMFMVPSLLFGYFTHPEPMKYLGLKKPANPLHLLLAVLLILGAMPILEQIQAWVGLIDFNTAIKQSQASSEKMTKAFLTMPTFIDFLRAFVVMAIIPAVGEELFFRGILARFAFKGSKKMWTAIIFSSVVFAYTHSNIYGMFSIFLAGVLLASIYYLTGSLWCSIIAHLCFNGTNIVLSYLAKDNATVKAFANSDHMPVGLLVSGAIVVAGSLYGLLKTKAPLTASWADDFDNPPPAPFPEFDSIN